MSIAVAFLTVKALRSCARFPRNLIVHGTAFFASFAARVALAFAFLMLRTQYHLLMQSFINLPRRTNVKYSILLSLIGQRLFIILQLILGKLLFEHIFFLFFFMVYKITERRIQRMMYSLEYIEKE